MKTEIEKIEIVPRKVDGRKNNGGARKGAGKKAGTVAIATTIKQIELAEVQMNIKAIARKLINSQTVTALGSWQMVTLERVAGKIKYVRVIDPEKMQFLIDNGEHGTDYLVFAAQDPDWKAASDLLNRAGLKPKEDSTPGGSTNIYNLVLSLENKNAHNSQDN